MAMWLGRGELLVLPNHQSFEDGSTKVAKSALLP